MNKSFSINKNILYDINDAIVQLKNITPKRKFDESVDIVIQLLKKKYDHIIRGVAQLTYKLKKNLKIVVFSDNLNDLKLAQQAGCLTGGKDLVEKIQNNKKIDCDVIITSPSFMQHLTIIGSILGPKRLMPNISLGTITQNIENKIAAIQRGEIYFTSDKYGNIHSSIARLSFPHEYICENIKDLFNAVNRHDTFRRNSNVISKIYISTTMGPSIQIMQSSI